MSQIVQVGDRFINLDRVTDVAMDKNDVLIVYFGGEKTRVTLYPDDSTLLRLYLAAHSTDLHRWIMDEGKKEVEG